jgi:hypothetical protein
MAKRGTLDHQKNFQLATALGIPECYSLGVLDSIWEWAGHYRPHGELTGVSPSFIARAIHYPGNGDELFQILIDVRFIDQLADGRLLIHDWPEHSENSVHQYLKNRGELFADGTPPFSRYIRRGKAATGNSQTDHKPFVNDSQMDHEPVTNDLRQPLPLPLPLPLPNTKANTLSQNSAPQKTSDRESVFSSKGKPSKGGRAAQDDVSSNGKPAKAKSPLKKPKAENPKPPPDPKHVPLREAFKCYYQNAVGHPAPWDGQEAAALKKFLKANPTITPQDWDTILSNRAASSVTHAYPLSKWIGTALSWLNGLADDWGHTITGGIKNGRSTAESKQERIDAAFE